MSGDKNINDLPDEILCNVFTFLTTKQLFQIKIICHKWEDCAREVIDKRITTLIFDTDVWGEKITVNKTEGSITIPYLIDENNIDTIKNLLTKCTYIRTVNLNGLRITGKGNLVSLAKLLLKIGCLKIQWISSDSHEELEKFAQIIGSKLISCHFRLTQNDHKSLLFKHFKVIEEIKFATETKEQDKQLFECLNSCKTLNKLSWKGSVGTNMKNPNVINVLQRIKYLKIQFYHFVQLKISNSMDNLIELEIKAKETLNGVEPFPLISNNNPMNEIIFYNLKKLWITKVEKIKLNLLSNLRFPQLEFVYINSTQHIRGENVLVDELFFKQIKKVKVFHCSGIQFQTGNLKLLKNLTEINILSTGNLTQINGLIDVMIHLKSLQNIALIYNLDQTSLNLYQFDKLILMGQTFSNAHIKFETSFLNPIAKHDSMKQFKQTFEKNNWQVLIRFHENKNKQNVNILKSIVLEKCKY